MKWFIAPKVDCCEPVAGSPADCVSCAAVKDANAVGMPPVRLKNPVRALPTFCWFWLSVPPGKPKFSFKSR